METSPAERVRCPHCRKFAPNQKALDKHVSKRHAAGVVSPGSAGSPGAHPPLGSPTKGSPTLSPTTAQCRECGRRFEDARALERHQLSAHSASNYSCGTCRKAFSTAPELVRHKMRHQKEEQEQAVKARQQSQPPPKAPPPPPPPPHEASHNRSHAKFHGGRNAPAAPVPPALEEAGVLPSGPRIVPRPPPPPPAAPPGDESASTDHASATPPPPPLPELVSTQQLKTRLRVGSHSQLEAGAAAAGGGARKGAAAAAAAERAGYSRAGTEAAAQAGKAKASVAVPQRSFCLDASFPPAAEAADETSRQGAAAAAAVEGNLSDAATARAAAASGAAARRRVEADVGETISKVRGASGVVVPNKQRSVAIGRSGTRLGQDTTTTATGEPRATRPAASAVGRRALQPTRIGLQ